MAELTDRDKMKHPHDEEETTVATLFLLRMGM